MKGEIKDSTSYDGDPHKTIWVKWGSITHIVETCKLVLDKDVGTVDKAKLGAAIVYFISPIDIVSDFVPGIGYLDDLALAAYVLNAIINHTDPAVVEKHWAGEKNILDAIKQILALADEMIGAGLFKKVKKFVNKQGKNG